MVLSSGCHMGTPFRVRLQTAEALLEPQGVEQQGVTEGRWVWAAAPTPLFRRPCAVFLSVLSHHKPGPQESEAGDERTAHSRSSENVSGLLFSFHQLLVKCENQAEPLPFLLFVSILCVFISLSIYIYLFPKS